MAAESIVERLAALIEADGPLPVHVFVEQALYRPDGFYGADGRAGRRGDFLTAPEVGPLFGAVVANALDAWWRELGSPSRFTVEEGGAGPGTLARAVIAAEPEVLTSGALRWLMVERSAAQQGAHPRHDQFESILPVDVPGDLGDGVVLANELLDNMGFDIFERGADGWIEIRVGHVDGRFVEHRMPEGPAQDLPEGDVPVGARIPRQRQARAWVRGEGRKLRRGRVVVFDYGGTTADLVARGGAWLRTYRAHGGGGDWLADPGSCDITTDVDVEQLQLDVPADSHCTQAEWLRRHGIDALVDEGRAIWEASAGVGDLAALRGRSRVREAEALTDPDGMGAFHVLEWIVDRDATK